MENSFNSLLGESKSILVLLPERPKFDEVAAGLSLYLTLSESKSVSIASSSPMVVEFNRLVGVNKIEDKLGSKNLVIYFKDYNADNVEKVSADVEGDEFRLTIVPQSGVKPPENRQIKFDRSGVDADMAVLVGGNSINDFPFLKQKDLESAKLVHIGNKSIDTQSQKVISLSSPASSVSERTMGIIQENGLNLMEDAATNLIAGIEEATQSFSSSNVSANTFEAMAALMKAGGSRKSGEVRRENYPPGAIPGERPESKTEDTHSKTPKDWTKPKIYKGTSVS